MLSNSPRLRSATFCAPLRTSSFEQPKRFSAAQNTTCYHLVMVKHSPKGYIQVSLQTAPQRTHLHSLKGIFELKTRVLLYATKYCIPSVFYFINLLIFSNYTVLTLQRSYLPMPSPHIFLAKKSRLWNFALVTQFYKWLFLKNKTVITL